LIEGGLRILYDGQSTSLLDSQQAGSAVVQVAGENDADNPGSIAERRGAEERIQGRPMAVLLGPTGETHMTVGHVQVAIGRGYVDPTRLDGLSIAGVPGEKWAGPVQNAWERARHRAGEMHDNEDGPRKIRWYTTNELGEHLDTAGRPADHYNIPPCHCLSRSGEKLS
jgi:hypothetical protein